MYTIDLDWLIYICIFFEVFSMLVIMFDNTCTCIYWTVNKGIMTRHHDHFFCLGTERYAVQRHMHWRNRYGRVHNQNYNSLFKMKKTHILLSLVSLWNSSRLGQVKLLKPCYMVVHQVYAMGSKQWIHTMKYWFVDKFIYFIGKGVINSTYGWVQNQ